jgi:hypothetical protein
VPVPGKEDEMKSARTVFAIAALCVCAWAAGSAVVGTRPTANLQSAIGYRQSAIVNGVDAVTIPQMMSYQGKLTDTLGQPVQDTTYIVTFNLYTVSSGGSAFWAETQSVKTRGGLFSVLLGSVTPIGSVPAAGALYLGMNVSGGVEMTPRLQIVSAAYAYKADTANYALAGAGGGGDDAWVRGGDSVLYTVHALGLSKGGSANALLGPSAMYHTNFGFRCTTGLTGQDRFHIAIGGGKNNVVSGSYSTIAGGLSNRVDGANAFIGGGQANAASGSGSTVGGGVSNNAVGSNAVVAGGNGSDATGGYSVVGGGRSNSAVADYGAVLSGYDNAAGDAAADTGAVVAGGSKNLATAKYATVGGGKNDTASGIYATATGGQGNVASGGSSTTGGGVHNLASGDYAVVGGGSTNIASGVAATVGGGVADTASGYGAAVGGGWLNAAVGTFSGVGFGQDNGAGDAAADSGAAVVGGYSNHVTDKYGFIGGGSNNSAEGRWSTVAGGASNRASNFYSTIGGGYGNRTNQYYATVAGGYCDTATGNSSVVAGGAQNAVTGNYSTIAGGMDNRITGAYSTIAGGNGNSLTGTYSLAFGRGVVHGQSHTVNFFDGNDTGNFVVNRDGYSESQHIIDVGTDRGNGNGAYLWSTGVWVDVGKRSDWEATKHIDGGDVLGRIAGLDVGVRVLKDGRGECVAPDGDEFSAALGIKPGGAKPGDGAISPLDVASVALIAIKELNQKLAAQQAEIEVLKAELKRR